MIDGLDVDRIITERITLKSIPPHHSRLIHKFIEEAVNEMKEIIGENRDLQYVQIWSEKKTNDLNRINYTSISELENLSGTWERTDGDKNFFYEKMEFSSNFFTLGSLITKLPIESPGSQNISCYLDLSLTKPGKGLIIFATPELESQESLPSAYGYVFKDSNHLWVVSYRDSEFLNANYSRVS